MKTIIALLLTTVTAQAQQCAVSAEDIHHKLVEKGADWVLATPNEWQFLRGVYTITPPPGLPLGDHAMLATKPGEPGGVVFFIDDDKVCNEMPIPDLLLKMLPDIKQNVIPHEGTGM